MRISCARCLCQNLLCRLSRTTCARSLHQDLPCKISLSGSLHQGLCRTTCRRPPSRLNLRRGLHFEIRNRNFTSISRDGHTRSPQRVALRNQKSQLHQHFVRWTRTISAEGCISNSEIATLSAFLAMDTHDLRRRLHFETKNATLKYLHSAHSTRTISAEGSHFKTMLQKHSACREIMSRGHTKCCTSQDLSPLTSKYRIHGADSLPLPRKTQSFE